MAAMVKRDRARPNRVRRFTAPPPPREAASPSVRRQIGDAGRGEDIARSDAFSDDQTIVADPADRDGALFYGRAGFVVDGTRSP